MNIIEERKNADIPIPETYAIEEGYNNYDMENADIPIPPEGFIIEEDNNNDTENANIPTPPEGFVIRDDYNNDGENIKIEEPTIVEEPTILEDGAQFLAGAAKLPAGLVKIINDVLPDDVRSDKFVDGVVKTLNEYTERYNKKHPDDMIHPSTVGELAVGFIPLFKASGLLSKFQKIKKYSNVAKEGTAKSAASSAAAFSFIDSVGNDNSYPIAAKDAIIGAALGGAGYKTLDRLFRNGNSLPKEAKYLLELNKGRISEDEFAKRVKNIPYKDRTIALAESLDLAKNYFSRAVMNNSLLSTKLGARLEARKSVIEPFIASEKKMKQTKEQYALMKKKLDEIGNGVIIFDVNSLLNKKLMKVYATDPSEVGTFLKKLKYDLSEGVSPSNALDLIENINRVSRKKNVSVKLKKDLSQVKDRLNGYLEKSLPDDLFKEVKVAVKDYKDVVNSYKLGKIIKKNTKGQYAVNWGKVVQDAKKDNLNGTTIDFIIPLLSDFEKKFTNDKYMGKIIAAVPKDRKVTYLGTLSALIGTSYDMVSPIINKSRYMDKKITNAIKKSINAENIKDPVKYVDEFIDTIAKTKGFNDGEIQDMRKRLLDIANENK